MWWIVTIAIAVLIGAGGFVAMRQEKKPMKECLTGTLGAMSIILVVSAGLSLFFTGDKTADETAQIETPTFFIDATGLLHNINIKVADLKLPALQKSANTTPENTQFDPNPQVSIVFSHPQGKPDKVDRITMVFQSDGTIKAAFYPLAVIAGLTPYLMPKERGKILESLMKKDEHGKISGSWADDYVIMSFQQTDFGVLFVATPK